MQDHCCSGDREREGLRAWPWQVGGRCQAGGGRRWMEKQKRPKVPAGQAVCRCFARCAIKAQSDSETEDTVESRGVRVHSPSVPQDFLSLALAEAQCVD